VLLIPSSAVTFASAAADRKHGGFLTAAQTQTAMTAARNLLLELQNSGTDYSQDDPTAAYALQYIKNKWVAQPVVIGLSDGASYEVLATSLSAGDTIVTGQSNSAVKIPKPTPTVSD
jgi:HlyD family secretion protein